MSTPPPRVIVVGAGLAGSECAFLLAELGAQVTLYEQKRKQRTEAQSHDFFAELVCSNSFRGEGLSSAVGLLKEEMRQVGSLVMTVGDQTRVPAGGAYAVDRELFGAEVERRLRSHPNITVVDEEFTGFTRDTVTPIILATGPLTSAALSAELEDLIGSKHLAYYDAIAPVILAESINWDKVYRASRYGKGGDDAYVNCPLNREEYEAFVAAIVAAEKVPLRAFERFFEGCLPIETMAERGVQTLAFGPMKPVGLDDPRTGRWPHAVVQLRQEDAAATAYNMVGFQTRMKWGEQARVFAMIPGLENAEFERFGTVHRNTFVNAPEVLGADLSLRKQKNVFLAGQIAGVEGYMESAAGGYLTARFVAQELGLRSFCVPGTQTALGALYSHLRTPKPDFQPSNVVWSHFDPTDNVEIMPSGKKRKLGKKERHQAMGERGLRAFAEWKLADLS